MYPPRPSDRRACSSPRGQQTSVRHDTVDVERHRDQDYSSQAIPCHRRLENLAMALESDLVPRPGRYKLKGQRLCNFGLAPYTSPRWAHEVGRVEQASQLSIDVHVSASGRVPVEPVSPDDLLYPTITAARWHRLPDVTLEYLGHIWTWLLLAPVPLITS